MAKQLRRPTKPMMMAVNAKIAGKLAEANKIIKDNKLTKTEFAKRLEMRDGEKYAISKKGGRSKGSGKKRGRPTGPSPSHRSDDVLSLMDGRSKTVTLLKIAYKANELLEAKPKAEVSKVEKAFVEADQLRAKYEEAMALIGE